MKKRNQHSFFNATYFSINIYCGQVDGYSLKYQQLKQWAHQKGITDLKVISNKLHIKVSEFKQKLRLHYNPMGVWIYRSGDENDYQKRIYLNWNEFADKVCSLIEKDKYIEQQEETLSPEEKIKAIVDGIVNEGTEKTTDGEWFNYFKDFNEDAQFVKKYEHEIALQLVFRKEVEKVGVDDDRIESYFKPEYCPNYDWDADEKNKQDETKTNEETVREFNRFKELMAEGKAYFDSYQIRYRYGIEPSYSMWGEVQSCTTIAKGIYEVSTAGHGGVMISTELAPHILSPEALEKGVKERGYFCYEEDCDACIPLRELYDKGILKPTDDYFTHYTIPSALPDAKEGRISFNKATEAEKAEFIKRWNISIF